MKIIRLYIKVIIIKNKLEHMIRFSAKEFTYFNMKKCSPLSIWENDVRKLPYDVSQPQKLITIKKRTRSYCPIH